MLSTDYFPAKENDTSYPVPLVFIHGLLGNGEDWKEVLALFADFPRITVDLPGHGKSVSENPQGFQISCEQISKAVQHRLVKEGFSADTSVVFIGYSLGARLAMYGLASGDFQPLNIESLFIEGGNFGLKTQDEKRQRLENDRRWSERFRHEPMEEVLKDWYLQPVFSSLTSSERENLVKKRAVNQGQAVANMLLSTSLAKQPYLLEEIEKVSIPHEYICGEKDQKFTELATRSGLSYTVITGAGHNVHKERPEQFAQLIRNKLGDIR